MSVVARLVSHGTRACPACASLMCVCVCVGGGYRGVHTMCCVPFGCAVSCCVHATALPFHPATAVLSAVQPVPVFITKCTQLYETVVVRHGLMLVGPTGGGKTNIMNTLQSALTILSVRTHTHESVVVMSVPHVDSMSQHRFLHVQLSQCCS